MKPGGKNEASGDEDAPKKDSQRKEHPLHSTLHLSQSMAFLGMQTVAAPLMSLHSFSSFRVDWRTGTFKKTDTARIFFRSDYRVALALDVARATDKHAFSFVPWWASQYSHL